MPRGIIQVFIGVLKLLFFRFCIWMENFMGLCDLGFLITDLRINFRLFFGFWSICSSVSVVFLICN